MSFIIIEWCDGTWKSFLANQLSEKLWWEIVHFSAPKWDAFTEYYDFYMQNRWKNLILDRFLFGEQVYWKIYRKKWMSTENYNTLMELYKQNWDIAILCYLSDNKIKDIFKTRWEEFTQIKDISKIQKSYKLLMWKVKNCILYNFMITDVDTLLNNLTPYIWKNTTQHNYHLMM